MRVFGSISYVKGQYEISDVKQTARGRLDRRMKEAPFFRVTCEPHVMIRLKRVFDGVYKGAHKTADIMESPQAAHDLLWFLERYPMKVDPVAQLRLESRSEEYQDRLKVVDEVLAGDYVPNTYDLVHPLRDYQALAVDLCLRSKGLLIADAAGLGKQMPVDTKVLTPAGWREIGTVVVGDRLIGSDGKPTVVMGVFPQGVKPSYRVRLSDGSSVEAGPEHLWTVRHRRGGRTMEDLVVTTDDLRRRPVVSKTASGRSARIDLARTKLHLPMLRSPVEFDDGGPLPFPPYALGVVIANGHINAKRTQVTLNSDDVQHVVGRMESEGVAHGPVRRYGNASHVPLRQPFGAMLVALDLAVPSGAKRIPRQFFVASPRDRHALLQGLMDCDGSISKTRNRVIYHTTSCGLAMDVVELVEGLGGIASSREYDRTDEGKPVEYQVRVRLPAGLRPCSSPRKDSRYVPVVHAHPVRTVESVEYVREVESVCVRVDAADSLFATEHCILTHNTHDGIGLISKVQPALVVCYPHLMDQWEEKIQASLPALRLKQLKVGRGTLADLQMWRGKPCPLPDVVICNYEKLHGWADAFAGWIKLVVFDEVQELRKNDSLKYAAAAMIAELSDVRCGLSATPIYNYGNEIWNVMNALNPSCLGSSEEFGREWCGGAWGDKAKIQDTKAFGLFMREQGLMIRRTRKDVGREGPPAQIVVHKVDVDEPPGLDLSDLAKRILAKSGDAWGRMQAAGEFDYKLRLATGVEKAPHVAAFVRMLLQTKKKVLLYGWHHDVYRIWRRELAEFKPVFYTGDESVKRKGETIHAFVRGDSRVMCASLRAGAGLDGLQEVCDTVVIGELDWSPGRHKQCIWRLDRDGQMNPEGVTAYYVITDWGSDPVIVDTLGVKAGQSDGMLDPDAEMLEQLQVDPEHMKTLARVYLQRQGIALPVEGSGDKADGAT